MNEPLTEPHRLLILMHVANGHAVVAELAYAHV